VHSNGEIYNFRELYAELEKELGAPIKRRTQASFIGKEFQFKTFWRSSLLQSMIFISNSKATVQ
jgi:asparagine synthetase B (glutamine-hydrolysing)